MHLRLGDSRMESGDYEGAIRSLGRARAKMRPHPSRALSVISLVGSRTGILQRIKMTHDF